MPSTDVISFFEWESSLVLITWRFNSEMGSDQHLIVSLPTRLVEEEEEIGEGKKGLLVLAAYRNGSN